MNRKITISPVTRISGFLEIEVEILNRKIVDAKSSGMLFRGFEAMLQGRDPLDAIYFTQRICGICSTAHSMASSFALENALNVAADENDNMIRDFIHGCEFVQNHIRHIYQYTFPDFVKGPEIHPVYVVSHNDFRLPEKLNKKIAQDYVTSIKYSRMAHEMLAELGGKVPHNHGIFVGGATVNMDISKYMKIKSMLQEIKEFVVNNMIEDVEIVGQYYPECFKQGIGHKNLMSYGCFSTYKDLDRTYVTPKVWINGKEEVFKPDRITEQINYSWYQDGEPDRMKQDAYSWIKAPRYNEKPMEVGPLARMWLGGYYRRGISLMDRTIARAYEAKRIIEIMEVLLERIQLKESSQKIYEIPIKGAGEGLVDTTRGALGHWVNIVEKKLGRYTIITPSGWNLSPMDKKGVRGPVEKALIGTEIADINHPVEIGRIVRSFDPCVSCATHVRGEYNAVEMIIG
ncbi:nickel-dependent hydrogenase large subunit [Oceanirhabdus sp. W0125-5]|uniref:nickel-dependent hydrogenase large subunit n=1 Tax=Oceanirhabdus sp. W0125-5 TaxID=2999116 RepID=UPI0022F2D3CF|nr:nickel-dependent hydrogenase large subunit [Oceanirhabdus sp. W0125-5]WBW99053.1 nickel-dependent hydrogenase large subunit [Oceanirhabdus sp. W0125-5]